MITTLDRFTRGGWCQPRRAALVLCVGGMGLLPGVAMAQTAVNSPAQATKTQEQGVHWQELKPAQQLALKPLEHDWAGIDGPRKQKWVELATRFPKLSVDEQGRIQARMVEWARLSPAQRGQARINFQEAKQLPAPDRQERWDAYQALPAEQKRVLAERAAPSTTAVAASAESPRKAASSAAGREPPQAKSNIVPNPALAAAPKAISPTLVQAGPGATTTSMTKRPAPPSHQQTGLPKIAGTPEFVDKATLLPQRGPQGAATRSAAASEPVVPKHP